MAMLKAFGLFLTFVSTGFGSVDDYNEELRCVWNCHRSYEGLLSTTITGKKCRYWTREDITHGNFQPTLMHNQCRQANFKHMPWCFLEDENGTNWEYCFHFHCSHFLEFKRVTDEHNLCRKPGFYEFEGKCYTVLPIPVTSRREGKLACHDHSSELLSIKSEREVSFVNSLTCVPKLLSAKYRNRLWQWSSKESGLWDLNEELNWCGGKYFRSFTGNCSALLGRNCVVKMDCTNSVEMLFPACVYTPEPTETVENISEFLTWKKAEEKCDRQGQELCLFEDLCNIPTPDKAFLSKYKSLVLPFTGDYWVPVGNQYNSWVYVGDRDSDSFCKTYTDHFGPPQWGIDPSNCEGNEKYCSNIGKIVCCQSSNRTLQDLSKEVTVYIESKEEEGVYFYRFSKRENKTISDVKKDQAMWRRYGRQRGDLRSFKLMSGYVEGQAEDPVFFCVKSIPSSIPTQRHLISWQPCPNGWELNFFLYAMKNHPEDIDSRRVLNLSVTTLQTETPSDNHSRIFVKPLEKSVPMTDLQRESFDIFTTIVDGIVEASPAQYPCDGQVEKIKAVSGVVATPNFPDTYPKRNPALKCKWKVAVEKLHLIKIEFTSIKLRENDMDFEEHQYFTQIKHHERFRTNHGEILFNHNQTCLDERIEITDASGRRHDNPNWVNYGRFCGTWSPHPFITTDNAVSVKFLGSRKNRGRGFSFTFETIYPPRGLEIFAIDESYRAQMTWKDAKGVCETKGKSICTLEDICGIGRPFYGVEKGNQWVPTLDEYNDWIQIGQKNGQTCQRHNAIYGPPPWGAASGNCDILDDTQDCSHKSFIYCCDYWVPRPFQVLNEEMLPVAKEVYIKVYVAVQNGITFYRYIRDKVDTVNSSSIWTFNRKHTGDVTRMTFYSNYKKGHDRVIYFCFKRLALAIGQLRMVYSMFAEPCDQHDWTLSFYLYASSRYEPSENLKKVYVGISNIIPYHSRAHFNNFPTLFQGIRSYIMYVRSPDTLPRNQGLKSNLTEPFIDTCSSYPVTVTAPGILVSPGYPKEYEKSMDCKWRVRLSEKDIVEGVKLKITIDELRLENRADYLLIYDVPLNVNFEELLPKDAEEYSGVVRHVSLITENSFILHFKSDFSVQELGFKLNIEIINDKCGGFIKSHGATLTSLNYPQKYPGDLNCTWVVEAPNAGYGIEIQFSKFEVKGSDNCTVEYFTLGPVSEPEKFKLCGIKNIPPRKQFNESSIRLQFVSAKGKSLGYKGFIFNVFFWPVGSFTNIGSFGSKCGLQEIQPFGGSDGPVSGRVVGGTEAIPGSWPWVVYLKEAACGGTLLNTKWVLSAGHCFAEKKPRNGRWFLKESISNYSVIAGRHHRTTKSKDEQIFGVESVILHPGYNRVRIGDGGATVAAGIPINDIALIRLKQAAIFTDTVSPICLPTQDVVVAETCVIAGWGARDILATFSGDDGNTLHYAVVPILANSICNNYKALRGSLNHNMTCAGFQGGGVDSCRGDSGGPLMCKGPGRSYQIKGVVSWGKGCGKKNQPGIYTRVWSHYEWISGIIYN